MQQTHKTKASPRTVSPMTLTMARQHV